MEELTSKEKELQRYKRYRDKDKNATAKRVEKSTAKRYITKMVTAEDLIEVKQWIKEAENNL